MRYWRAYLRVKDALVNTGVALNNYILRPCSLFLLPRAEWCVCALCLCFVCVGVDVRARGGCLIPPDTTDGPIDPP